MVKFWLGTHKPNWLPMLDVPLFISRKALERIKTLPRAKGEWALDSGGFTELNKDGRWTITPKDYVSSVRRYQQEIGNLAFAAIQDWMCEPFVLQKTGASVKEHQTLTVSNCLDLLDLAPELPWLPVLQGWEMTDYLRHVEQYERAGIDLRTVPLVGLGSVCRRQHTDEVETLIRRLTDYGIRLHGFGFKVKGLQKVCHTLASADSLAWSFQARFKEPMPGCTSHKNCANCLVYALHWRERLTDKLYGSLQAS